MVNLIRKYYNAFHFYFGKPIIEIMGNLSIDHVILYKDFQLWDDNKEYLKGYYEKDDTKNQGTIAYKESIVSQIPKPNLIIVTAHRIVEKRYTKLLKLQKMAVINNQVQPQQLLFNTTQNNELSSEIQEYQQQQKISWETKSHNIYSSNSISNNTNYSNKQLILNKSNSIQQLYYIVNENDLSKVIKETNQYTNRQLNKLSNQNKKNNKQSNKQNSQQKQKQNIVKNIQIPRLQIPKIEENKSNKINFNQLMYQYDQILSQRFNKGCQTERNQQNKQDIPKQLVYLTNSLHKAQTQNSCKNSSSQFYKQSTCSPSILLKSLSKWTLEQNEQNKRRSEIKQNLNKLIKQQEKDLGYYTHR